MPGDDVAVHDAATWEYIVVIGVNVVLLLVIWTRVAKYTRSLIPSDSSSDGDLAQAVAAPH